MEELTLELQRAVKLTTIPQIDSTQYERNESKSLEANAEHICACCGREIIKPKYYINTAFGGAMYIPIDETVYRDTWQMPVGNTCMKKFNKEYIFEYEEV